VGNQQLSIHIKTLLDDLKSSKDYCPRNLFSGSNSSPEKSLQKIRSIFGLENQSCDRRKPIFGNLPQSLQVNPPNPAVCHGTLSLPLRGGSRSRTETPHRPYILILTIILHIFDEHQGLGSTCLE